MIESIIETTLLVAFAAALAMVFRALAHIGRTASGQHRVELYCGCKPPLPSVLYISEKHPFDYDYCELCGYLMLARLWSDGRILTKVDPTKREKIAII